MFVALCRVFLLIGAVFVPGSVLGHARRCG
jgi:hypothetical protein